MKNFTFKAFAVLSLIAAGMVSCKEDGPQQAEKPQATFYVAGAQNVSGKYQAAVWVNGIPQKQGEAADNSWCSSLALVGNDLYSAVNESGNAGYASIVYKNNVEMFTVASGRSEECKINSIAVSGGKVYSCGYTVTGGIKYSKIWENGTQYLAHSGNSDAVRVIPAGGSIYSVINEGNNTGIVVPRIYKEAVVEYTLTDGTKNAYVVDALYSNGNIYSVGNIPATDPDSEDIIKLWRNGNEIYSINATDVNCVANGLFVNGSDIYVGGYSYDASGKRQAKVWKNGNLLYSLNGGAQNAEVSSVAMWNGFVYSSGYTDMGASRTPIIWWENAIYYKMQGGGDKPEIGQMFVR